MSFRHSFLLTCAMLCRCAGDIMIATEAVDAVEALVDKNGGEYRSLVASACTPLCLSVLSSPDKFVGCDQ